jgi:hypothetical protein
MLFIHHCMLVSPVLEYLGQMDQGTKAPSLYKARLQSDGAQSRPIMRACLLSLRIL